MGLFSRDSGSGSDRRKSGRSTTDSQANELRVRARRRLVGALVLVVAAVIVVPMLIDTNPPADDALQPIVLPPVASSPEGQLAAVDTGSNGSITIEQVDIPAPSNNDSEASGDADGAPSQTASSAASAEASRSQADNVPSPTAENAAPGANGAEAATSSSAASRANEPEPEPEPESEPKPARDTRSDDGAVALALLEGRQPPDASAGQPSQGDSGSFVLQIAAYTTEQDANARREKLFEAGVTNAFVERATSAGKPTYRLRVGPFPSREAAQAAQTRLRALGYDNGFISSK